MECLCLPSVRGVRPDDLGLERLSASGHLRDCGGRRYALDEVIGSMLCARLILHCSASCSGAGRKLSVSRQDSVDFVFLFFPQAAMLVAVRI